MVTLESVYWVKMNMLKPIQNKDFRMVPLFFPGLKGRFCEINIDNCAGDPCGVLSVCKDALNGYSCFCAPGFIGKFKLCSF